MIRCSGLTKVYGEITALADLDLEIAGGQVFGYIGHNGAGKTTTIRLLAGLLKPSAGHASIGGVEVAAGGDRIKPLVGYLPESFGVYDQMRVWEYLDFFGAAFKIPRRKRARRIDFVLEVTEAGELRDRFVDTLSLGMKQRVGIARTLLHDPKVLLLDEPASGLDPQARMQMRKLLRRLADDGKTLLVSSHILPELAAVCDSIGILHHGRLRAAGDIHQVLGQIQRDRLMELKTLGGSPPAGDVLARDARCSQTDASDGESGILRFRFSGDDEALAGLLGALHAAGAGVVTLREVPLSLEDAYLAISGISSEVPGSPEAEGGEEAKPKG